MLGNDFQLVTDNLDILILTHQLQTPLVVISLHPCIGHEVKQVQFNSLNIIIHNTATDIFNHHLMSLTGQTIEVDRLDHLIAKLIRLARLEERKDQAPVTVDFSQLVQRVSHNMSALWEQEGLHYEADIQEDISLQGGTRRPL